jgi:hypothetical protein
MNQKSLNIRLSKVFGSKIAKSERQRKCQHNRLEVETEDDGCYWVWCAHCGKMGPKKHSRVLALLAWIVRISNKHPRAPKIS